MLRVNMGYINHLNITSTTTLIVENLFAEARSCIEMPLMSQFCHLFERAVRERLKRFAGCPFSYYTGEYKHYQEVTNNVSATT
jgi:hypothetical protein